MNRKCENYYLGVDIGTNSVGWAVTDENYNVLSFHNRAMWGVRLFDEAMTAAGRRQIRTSRRRLARRIWRLELLQEIFAEEICKRDPAFYRRMKESMLYEEDKTEGERYSLFNDKKYTDQDYYREYPTIYHLRKALLTEKKEWDIRLVYLAVHHIVKHRGHFLFNGSVEKATSFTNVFEQFKNCMKDDLEIQVECQSEQELEETLKSRDTSKRDKNARVMELLHCEKDKQLKAAIGLICGLTVKMADLFHDDSLKEIEKPAISFATGAYEDTRNALETDLQERCGVVDVLKSMYDWSVLADILAGGEWEGETYLSVAKVNFYEKHKEDLRLLKGIFREIGDDVYRDFFQKEGTNNYCAYIKSVSNCGKKKRVKGCKYEDMKKNIKSILDKYEGDRNDIDRIMEELDNETFLPLQVSKNNGVIPYQVNEMELRKILENVSEQYPFLTETDSYGLTAMDKIVKIFKFRVPYFVGPLNSYHNKNAWVVRKEEGTITPWNIEQKIDFEGTGEKFIRRMTNKCTYLIGKDVVPKNSLIYSEYMVWNEINNIKIGQEKIPVELKEKMFQTLYLNCKKVKRKDIEEFLISEGVDLKENPLSGIDIQIKSSLSSYHDFRKIFGDEVKKYSVQQMVENIINWITVYSGDEKMLKRVIRKTYGEDKISDEALRKIVRLRYQGWGRLSKEFLDGIEGFDTNTGKRGTILYMLRHTNDNLMQILSQKYTFSENIEQENAIMLGQQKVFSYDNLMENVVGSPAIKRAAWQSLLISREVTKIMGKEPKKIFIEMARSSGEKKRTVSRKDTLKLLYKNIKDKERDWLKEIDGTEESKFRSIKYYLYYTQMGRCMYTGDPIDLSELMDTTIYDRDHIYPQSKTKDDSLDNLVLVKKSVNQKKDNDILSPDIQLKMQSFWKYLKRKNLISEKKYERLMRKTPLTDEELAGFINRQIVETSQSTKLVAQLMKEAFDTSQIVYVKAGLVSEFRHEEKLIKVRSLNDYHHAKDAYLNIVVGNVYHEKFTGNPLKWLKNTKERNYSLSRVYDYDLLRGDRVIWKKGKKGSIATIKKQMEKNDIRYTRYTTTNKAGQNGGFFDQQIVSKTSNAGVPVKKGMDVTKYGGYKTITPAYFALVESEDKKGNKQRSIEAVPLYLLKQFESGEESFAQYCADYYGLINPRIILNKIKKDTLFVIDRFPMHLRGTTGKQLLFQGAVQLCLEEEDVRYLKKLEKYLQRNAEYKGKELLPISEWDGITKEQNEHIYQVLCGKLEHTIYKYRPNNQCSTLIAGKKMFTALLCEEQCILLNEVMWIMRCKAKMTADLRMLKGSSQGGKLAINKVISKCEKAIIKNQSITGLYEQTIDLLRI